MADSIKLHPFTNEDSLDHHSQDVNKEEGEVTPLKEERMRPVPLNAHKLENSWTFWFDNADKRPKGGSKDSWGTALRKIDAPFSTVEEFWSLYNNMKTPSCLPKGSDLHCFKSGIEPKWEDPMCASGGKWTMNVRKDKVEIVDTLWLHTLLALIGEQLEDFDAICGAVASIRQREDRVAIWTKTADNEKLQHSIAKQWKKLVANSGRIGFISHEDAKRDEKRTKERYWE